jgi:hypothetical protein
MAALPMMMGRISTADANRKEHYQMAKDKQQKQLKLIS